MLTRLTHLVGNSWLRGGLLAIVLSFCGYGLYSEWPQVTAGLARLHWYSVVLSLAATVAGTTCMMLGWRAVLADLGSPLPAAAAARVNFVAGLGKYVPGAVWSFAAQVELGHDLGVPRRRSVASFVISIALLIGAGLGVAAAALPLASPGMARHYLWVLAALPLIAVGLWPPVFGTVVDRGLRLARRAPLERRPSWRGLAYAIAWNVLGWLLLGIQVWLLMTGMTGRNGYLLLATGGYALAFAVGLLLVIFPSGVGARELILIAALSPVMPHGTAVAVALVTRLLTTVSDLLLGAVGLALRRGAAGSGTTAAAATSPYAGTSKSSAGSSS